MGSKAVIFDLYGVLALNGWQAFKAKHFREREGTWTEVFELGRRVDAGTADYTELIRFTAKKTGESEATVRYQLEHTLVNDELLHYITSELKPHYLLGILSNASKDEAVNQLLTSQQKTLFDAIILSHHYGLTKPQVEMYEAIARKLKVDVAECVFIDDQERHAAGARFAGMQALVYTDVPTLKKELAKIL